MTHPAPLSSAYEIGVLYLDLDRPQQRNALNLPLIDRLRQALDEAEARSEVRAIVLRAAGPAFCSGADVVEWAEAEKRGQLETYGWTESAHALMRQLIAFPKPTLAAIQGRAVGAGVDLALCCDLRIASRGASFRSGYTGMAYCPDAGASWHLPRLMGPEAARRYLFLDETWSAERALAHGLVGEVCGDDELNQRTREVARRLAAGPTLAFAHTKRLLAASAGNPFADQLEAERQAGLLCGRSQDAAEALLAATEKRDPQFKGN